jgi:hypothetical protein
MQRASEARRGRRRRDGPGGVPLLDGILVRLGFELLVVVDGFTRQRRRR